MTHIVPAFLVESEKEFEQNLRLVENDCSLIQVDVLDGSLFPNTCWFDAERVGNLKTNVEMELHLMVENPIPIIEAWKRHVPTFTRAIVHAEMHRPTGAITGFVKDQLGLQVGVALNPESPLREIEEVLHQIDQLTIMSVHPGRQGQTFGDPEHGGDLTSILDKIAQARAHRPDLMIEVDGGITAELVPILVKAGANRLCVGGTIFKSTDPTGTLKALNQLVREGRRPQRV
jgi:ribulose-phosphate 3-epimerase